MPTPSIADTYFSIPELMRVAHGSYKRAVDIQLAAGGFEDLPTASGYLLAYIANDEESIPERIEGLGIKQREFRQLVDTLVLRGYLTAKPVRPMAGCSWRSPSAVARLMRRASRAVATSTGNWRAGCPTLRWPASAVDLLSSAKSSSP